MVEVYWKLMKIDHDKSYLERETKFGKGTHKL